MSVSTSQSKSNPSSMSPSSREADAELSSTRSPAAPITPFRRLSIRPREPPSRGVYLPPHRRHTQELDLGIQNVSAPPRITFHPIYTEGLGRQLDQLSPGSDGTPPVAPITDARVAGSYKWIESPGRGTAPTIVVPAIPDVWVGPPGNEGVGEVERDEDLQGNIEYPDYNAHSMPDGYSPLEPIILCLSSPAHLRDLDLITGRNNLKKLFAFCLELELSYTLDHGLRHHGYRHGIGPFRMDAYLLPGTEAVVLERWEPPSKNRGQYPSSWHLSYHEKVTVRLHRGADRTSGCHRVIRYDFGGIKVMVKSDVDAVLSWNGALSEERYMSPLYDQHQEGCQAGEDHAGDDAMSLDIASESPSLIAASTAADSHFSSHVGPTRYTPLSKIITAISKTSNGIQILRSQVEQPPQSHLISIKTRSIQSNPRLAKINMSADVYAGLLFGQIPNLYLARHFEGYFSRGQLEKHRYGEGELLEMEKQYEGVVGRVRELLGYMMDATRRHGRVSFVGHRGRLVSFELKEGVGRFSREAKEIIRAAGRGGDCKR